MDRKKRAYALLAMDASIMSYKIKCLIDDNIKNMSEDEILRARKIQETLDNVCFALEKGSSYGELR